MNWVTRIVVIFQVVLLTFPQSLSAASDCKSICAAYNADAATCANIPAGCTGCKKEGPYVAGLGAAADTWQELCLNSNFSAKWGQTGSQCIAMDAAKKGSNNEMITASLYTGVAAICWTACMTTWAFATLEPICKYGDIAAGVADIGLSLTMAKDTASKLTGAIGGGVAVGVGAFSGKLGGMVAGKAGGDPITNSAGKTVGTKSQQTGACITAGVSTLLAALKWYNMSQASKSSDKSCNNVASLSGASAGASTGGTNLSSPNYQGTGGATQAGTGLAYADEATQKVNDYLNGTKSAATAGLLDSNPYKNRIPNALNSLGTSVDDLTHKVATTSPSNILGGMPFSTPEFKAALADMDKDIRDGKYNPAGIGSYGGGGGGGGAKSGGDSGGMDLSSLFGKKGDAADPRLGTMNLDTGKAAANPEDIWHFNSKQSLFEIVSSRIEKSQPKVNQCEWITPLNRAIMGLPKQSAPIKVQKHP